MVLQSFENGAISGQDLKGLYYAMVTIFHCYQMSTFNEKISQMTQTLVGIFSVNSSHQ